MFRPVVWYGAVLCCSSVLYFRTIFESSWVTDRSQWSLSCDPGVLIRTVATHTHSHIPRYRYHGSELVLKEQIMNTFHISPSNHTALPLTRIGHLHFFSMLKFPFPTSIHRLTSIPSPPDSEKYLTYSTLPTHTPPHPYARLFVHFNRRPLLGPWRLGLCNWAAGRARAGCSLICPVVEVAADGLG